MDRLTPERPNISEMVVEQMRRSPTNYSIHNADTLKLVAEIDRLRAELAQAKAEIERMRTALKSADELPASPEPV